MPEPFSITAGIVGIAVPTLEACRKLIDIVQEIQRAPEEIRRLSNDLGGVATEIQSFESVKDSDWERLGPGVAENITKTLSFCNTTCNEFGKDLEKWTVRAADGSFRWQDKVAIGYTQAKKIKAITKNLKNCKITLSMVVSSASTHGVLRGLRTAERTLELIERQENTVSSAAELIDQRLAEVSRALADLQVNRSGRESESASAYEHPQAQVEVLEVGQIIAQELLNQLNQEREQKENSRGRNIYYNKFGDGNSGYQAGTINGPFYGRGLGNGS